MGPEHRIRLFRDMLRIRIIEERIADLYPQQEMRCPVHISIGQEAVAVGVCANLTATDYVLSGHRSHGHYLAKGGGLAAMMAELYGKASGCAQGKGGSMHLVDLSVGFLGATPIVGSTIPIAVGASFASKMRGEDRVTVIFFGEAATEEGVFHESVNFAALKGLPIIFVCENNLYSVYSPLSVRQPQGRDSIRLVEGLGVEAHRNDGNDVQMVSLLAGQAIAKARRGGGPTFLEFETYRWREHVGPYYDNALGYRTEAEFLDWKDRCPIEMAKRELLEDGLVSHQDIDVMGREFLAHMDDAVAFAKNSPFPGPSHMLEHVYAP